MSIVSFVLILQILIPLRYLIYDGELFWHEQGYRFSMESYVNGKIRTQHIYCD